MSIKGNLETLLFVIAGTFFTGITMFLLVSLWDSEISRLLSFGGFGIYPLLKRYNKVGFTHIQKDIQEITNKIRGFIAGIFSLGVIIIIGGLILWGGYHLLTGLGNILTPKYEGMTAKEWANESNFWEGRYNNFRTCVEDYDNFEISTQLEYGGVFYYCE